jgi:3D (Asp-Asp-Asp) domain-containing protein
MRGRGAAIQLRRLQRRYAELAALSRRRDATPLIGLALLVSLLCYGVALYRHSTSGHTGTAIGGRVPGLPASLHATGDPANSAAHLVAQRAGADAGPHRSPTRPLPAATAVLTGDPPSMHTVPQPGPRQLAMQPATDMVPDDAHRASLRTTPPDRREAAALPVVDAVVQTYNQQAMLRDIQPAAGVGDVPARAADGRSPAHRLAVWVTGYTLSGITALGTEAGRGICAVDPAVIPLGTRITVDGLGTCTAEDTGPEVLGPHVDVWVPTVSEAYALTGWHTASW